MLIKLWILWATTTVVLCELSGDHICQFEERFTINSTDYVTKNATVRNYKWCMGFPPRCSFYTFKTIKVPQIIEKNESRVVIKCCPGYAENEENTSCVPCMKCFEGKCGIQGKCICNSGFQGEDCSNACEPLRWGINCSSECLCERGACDPRTGRCDCPTGWFGTRCELLCLEGFYGKHCINRCKCGERELCSPETGGCSPKPNRQEHQSTRAIHYMTDDIFNITNIIDKQHKSTPSLKKYYTFDMELNTTKPYETSSSTSKFVEKSNSVESTTEISMEEHSDEFIPIINENSSLEKFQNKIEEMILYDTKTSQTSAKYEPNRNSTPHEKENILVDEKYKLNVPQTNPTLIPKEKHESTVTELNTDAVTKKLSTKVPKKIKFTTYFPKISASTTQSTISVKRENTDILPILKTTPSMNINKKENYLEEDLQNLDNLNVLTSKETSTPPITIKNKIESVTFENEVLLQVTNDKPSTQSLNNYLGNDLTTVESTENRPPLKQAFDYPRNKESNYFSDQASGEFEYSTTNTEKNDLSTNMAVAGLISFILVLIISSVISIHHYARKKRNNGTKMKTEHHQMYPGGPRVSVYAHSIFHTPLPDPPTFENPVFVTPLENSNDHRTIQTHVVCSLNFSGNHHQEEKEYTYDHPPSTGSYRAASIPEPPDIQETITEPLYDEIPSNGRIEKPVSSTPPCIYMNTCGKTRF